MTAARLSEARVLLVEDEDAARLVLGKLLGYDVKRVEVTGNGAKALERVREDPPDVVVTGLPAPPLEGLAFVQELHDHNPDLPVVVVTAFGDLSSSQEAKRAGAEAVITKPVDYDALLMVIEHALERRQAHH